MTTQTKVALAPVTVVAVAEFTKGMAGAVALLAKADVTFAETVGKLVAKLAVKLTAAQYDKQVGPSVRKALDDLVSKGKLSATSKASMASRVKTQVLADMWGIARIAGEGVKDFTTRASTELAKATTDTGERVYEPKVGRPANTREPSKPRVPGSVSRELDAAMALLGDNRKLLAEKLVIACASFPDELTRWLDTIVIDEPKGAKAPKPAKVEPVPNTAMSAALLKAAKPNGAHVPA